MGIKIRIRRGIVHLVTTCGGIRTEESTGLHISENPEQNKEVMKLAELLRSKKELLLIQGQNGMTPPESKLSLYEYVEKQSQLRRESIIYKCLPYLDRFGGRRVRLIDITPGWFEDFQERIKKDSGLKSAHTQEKYCCLVRQCLKKAVRDGLITRDPSSGIRHIPVPDSKKEFLSLEEVRKMAVTPYIRSGSMPESLQMEIRKAFLFGCCTGFRISDLIQLKWNDIDFNRMEIIKRQKKTRKMVVVPVKQTTLAILGETEPTDWNSLVFPELAKTRTTTNRYLHGWANAAGVRKNVSWHTARHTDATLLLEYGADLYTVMRLLGHTRIQTTMQYAVVSDRKKKDAVAAVPEFITEQTAMLTL